MKKLILKIFLFSLPFALLAALIVLVDPYEYFDHGSMIPHEDKLATAYRLNYPLWKLIHYKREPSPNILLGDSRLDGFPTDPIHKITGLNYANLAYGGGTLDEICDTFWEAAARIPLKKVYIGLNLNLYNSYNSRNRVEGAKAVIANPLLYIINRNAIHATFLLIQSRFSSRNAARSDSLSIEHPEMTREEFWRYQLGIPTTRFYANYSRPDSKYHELQRISEYCRQKGVTLVFIIPPTHEDLRKKVRAFGLEKAEDRFRQDLSSLGPVYDFDWLNDCTGEKTNFNDPYHLKSDKINFIIEEIWGNKLKYARIISKREPG